MDTARNSRVYKRILRSGEILGFTCVFLASIILTSYLFQVESFYRPFANGSASHPLSAVSAILLGVALLGWHFAALTFVRKSLIFTTAVIAILLLIDRFLDTSMHGVITPFQHLVLFENSNGKQNEFCVNSALMYLLIAVAMLLAHNSRLRLSQLTALVALSLPTISLTGYAFDFTYGLGHMSFTTASLGFFLSLGALTLSANQGVLNKLIIPDAASNGTAWQLLFGLFVPIAFGYLFFQSVTSNHSNALFGVYVVGICWTLIILSAIMVALQEFVSIRLEKSTSSMNTHNDDLY